ncbi:MAG TPA: hypothetical protein ENI44_02125, partial [Thermoplasmatales archaeon]|nr:hypothetical protein [Thermoplasmatales archaeon]
MDFILPDLIFDKGVYYIVVGSQAYTLNSSDYDVFYNVSFVFPENYSMSIEVYKQADPIGVSFCEMNASYVYWDIHYDRFAH